MAWTTNKACLKCGGDGWLWDHELREYPRDVHAMGKDDTKYSCDCWCHTHDGQECDK